MSGGSRPRSSQRIEQFAQELEKIISVSAPIRHLADGFGGPHSPAEGPVWWQEGGYLLFSDIHNNRKPASQTVAPLKVLALTLGTDDAMMYSARLLVHLIALEGVAKQQLPDRWSCLAS